MPTVPSYSGPQVEARGPGNAILNTTRATPDAFGASIGRGIEGAGQGISEAERVMAKAAERMKQRQDANEVMGAENMLTEWEQSRLNDPDSGYFASRGMQASGGTKRILEDYTLQADTIRKSMKNADQQLAFDRIVSSRKNSIGDAAARHEASQTRQATLDNTNAAIANSINGAVGNYTDPKSIEFNLVNGTRAIMTQAALNGQSDEVTAQQISAFTSKAHTSVLERMMVNSPGAAREYYNAHKDEIDGAAQGAIEQNLKASTDKDAARQESERIFSTGASLADMLGEARKIENTDVSDQAVARIKSMYEELEKSKTQSEEKVWQNLVQNPSYDNIPVSLDGTTQVRMREYVDTRLTKGLITTSPEVYKDLITMAANSPQDFLQVSLPSLATHLDKSAMDYLKTLQKDISEGGSSAVAGVRSQNEMVKGQLKGLGLKDDDKRGQAFYVRAQEEVSQFQRENKRAPNAQEFQGILDRLSTVAADGWFKDSYLAELTVDGVPGQYIDEIAESLRKKGKPLTDSNIRQTYLLAKQKGLLGDTGAVPANAPASLKRNVGPVSKYDGVSDALTNAIHTAAAKTGEDADLMMRIAGAESSYGRNTSNPNSSAAGPFQIVGGTWDDIKNRLGADVNNPDDPYDAALAAATYLKDLRKTIEPVAGKNPTDGDIYIAWFAGGGGARNIIGAMKNGQGKDKVTDYLTQKQIAANRTMLYDRLGRPLTVAQFYELMSNKVA